MLNSRSVIYVYVENDRLKLISIWSGIGGVNESDNRDWNWLVLRVVLEASVNLTTETEIDWYFGWY
jgi:hypothetical protein